MNKSALMSVLTVVFLGVGNFDAMYSLGVISQARVFFWVHNMKLCQTPHHVYPYLPPCWNFHFSFILWLLSWELPLPCHFQWPSMAWVPTPVINLGTEDKYIFLLLNFLFEIWFQVVQLASFLRRSYRLTITDNFLKFVVVPEVIKPSLSILTVHKAW